MKKRTRTAYTLALAVALLPGLGIAQLEHLTTSEQQAFLDRLPAVTATAKASLQNHLRGFATQTKQPEERVAAINAVRVALDADSLVTKQLFVHYAIPAMSPVQRLSDLYPTDGTFNEPVRILAAGGEYEPGAFSVYPLADLGKVSLSLTPFRNAKGVVFPAPQLDLKLVKNWYQNKNAWYSYFGDTGFKLVSELLVNDEDLIRVDPSREANYARRTAPDGTVSYQWINPPRQIDQRFSWHYRHTSVFQPMRADFADAKTLQPVTLSSGQFTTFFLTANVTTNIAPGLYEGAVKLSGKKGELLGEVPVTLRVLPFKLPDPKSYFDLEKDFLTASYSYISLPMIMEENGGDLELAKQQLRKVLRNQVEHNQNMHWIRGGNDQEVLLTLEIIKEVGMRTDWYLGGVNAMRSGTPEELSYAARRAAAWFDKTVGHHNVYIGFGDEPGATWLMNARPVYEAYQREGFKFILAGGNSVFSKIGYALDWHNVAKWPEDDSATRLWNAVGNAHVAWYAAMHVGSENPAFNRRQYGLAPYLANYSAACNYAHHFGSYNDDSTTYRPMVFAYGIHGGVLDTLQWEGYREGIDDIRYATLLVSLARTAAQSKDLDERYAGNQALQFLASLNRSDADLNAARLEMIRHIMALSNTL